MSHTAPFLDAHSYCEHLLSFINLVISSTAGREGFGGKGSDAQREHHHDCMTRENRCFFIILYLLQ